MHISPVTFQGVEIDPMKRADWTPLMLACTKQDDAIVKFLTEHGASPRLRNKDGWNSFHLACREGNTTIVSFLFNRNPTLLGSRSKNGRTPLHTAGAKCARNSLYSLIMLSLNSLALHGHLDVVKLLTERSQEDLHDVKDSCGTTPLMDAIRAGHVSIARHLVDTKVCSSECRDGMGRMPIHLAAQVLEVDFLVFSDVKIYYSATCRQAAFHRLIFYLTNAMRILILLPAICPARCIWPLGKVTL